MCSIQKKYNRPSNIYSIRIDESHKRCSLKRIFNMNYEKIVICFILFFVPNINTYGQTEKIVAKAFENRRELYNLYIQEATLKIEANNAWIQASIDSEEVKELKKNNKEQMKTISNIKKIQKRTESAYNKNSGSNTKLTKREAEIFKLLGASNGQNAKESREAIDRYKQKIKNAEENASKTNNEDWDNVIKKWEDVIDIVQEIEKISHTSMIYFYVAAEMISPRILVGDNEEDQKEMERIKNKVIQEIYEDESL